MTRRKDGRWQTRLKLPNGSIKYFYSNAKTEREATRDINKQILQYEQKEKSGKSFAKVADAWNSEFRERIPNISYNKNYRAAYERIISHFSNNKDIMELSASTVNLFINDLIAKKYSKKTIANHKSVLNMIFSYAVIHGYIVANPVREIRLPNNLPKKKRELPATDDIKIVNSHWEGFDLLPYFLLNTGARISEALAISYEDIDYTNKLIPINKHVIHDGNKPILEYKTKTENSERTVILLDRLAEKLPKNKKGLIFGNEDETPLTKRQLACRWKKYQDKYGIKITAHQLRHAYATMLFEAGIDVKDAQELMGHSDINLTRQIYTHIRNERKIETANKLNNFSF